MALYLELVQINSRSFHYLAVTLSLPFIHTYLSTAVYQAV